MSYCELLQWSLLFRIICFVIHRLIYLMRLFVEKSAFSIIVPCSRKDRYCSFLLISVWFLANKDITVRSACRKIWLLWRELFFGNIVGMCCRLFIPSFEPMSVNDWWSSWLNLFFPLTRNEWWYVSSYAVFFDFAPVCLSSS